jgi:hypothetical protein
MNDDKVEELKQFIDRVLAANISDVRSNIKNDLNDLRNDIRNSEIKLSAKIDDLSEFVANTIDATDKVVDDKLKDHEQRITVLEQKAV